MILIATIFVLVTDGIYLLFQRLTVRAMSRFGLLSHAVSFVLLTTDVPGWRTELIIGGTSTVTVMDPLPQTFMLTVVVIILATSILMFAITIIGCDDNILRHPETGEIHCV